MTDIMHNIADESLVVRATALIHACAGLGLTIATAESCTGGLLAGLLTEVPGSSAVLERGFVTYSNAAKTDMLGVPAELIAQYGAVSGPVAGAMAEGAIAFSRAHIAVSITGVAGPGGGSADKPVGLVHFARTERGGETYRHEKRFDDNGRAGIRRAALDYALSLLEERIASF
jgi:nicotinamide-nucleotide amidase